MSVFWSEDFDIDIRYIAMPEKVEAQRAALLIVKNKIEYRDKAVEFYLTEA